MQLVNEGTTLVRHVLVADSGLARLFRLTGSRLQRRLEEEAKFDRPSAHLPAHALTTDISGRVFESAGRAGVGATRTRHGAASDYNPHTIEIERYVARIGHELESRHRTGRLSNLTVIAEPRLLGVLRAHLPNDIQKLVTREISGDYTHANHALLLRVLGEEPTG